MAVTKFTTNETTLLARNGHRLPVYSAIPESAEKVPAVIIVHEIFGLNDHIRDIARRFAAHNIAAFAPDLFADTAGPTTDRNDLNAMRTVWSQIPDAQLIADLQTVYQQAVASDKVLPDKVGTMGFCMGGAIAFMFASSTPEIPWVADYYGRIEYPQLTENKPKHPIDYATEGTSAVLGLFAGHDDLITGAQIKSLEERLRSANRDVEIKVYDDAKHAFFNDQREFYNQTAATDAWKRTLEFISRTTSSSAPR